MLTELLNSYDRERTVNHKKHLRMRRFEIYDHVRTEESGSQSVAVPPVGAFVARIAGWLGRLRPARVG